jgi:hypothetical protein
LDSSSRGKKEKIAGNPNPILYAEEQELKFYLNVD